jgi:type IV pilus assembly protein PilZ
MPPDNDDDSRSPREKTPEEEAQGRDRRRSPRVLVDLEVDYSCEDTFLFAYITDMSALGIFVRTNAPEPPGTLLNVRFTLPGDRKPLTVEGRVVWINAFRPGDVTNINPGMGIKFVNVDHRDRRRIVALVRKIAYLEGQLDDDDYDDDEPVVTPVPIN